MERIDLRDTIIIYCEFNASLLAPLSREHREDRLDIQEETVELIVHLKELEICLEHIGIGIAPSGEDEIISAEFAELLISLFERQTVLKILI